MSNRDRMYNASEKGKARKQRYRSANRKALLSYGRRYYRNKRLKDLRAALVEEQNHDRRSRLRSSIAKILVLIRNEGKK